MQLTPEQVKPAWSTVKIEVVFDPKTGNIKPWEVCGFFTFPQKSRSHFGSFKTEAAAKKAAVKHIKQAKEWAGE